MRDMSKIVGVNDIVFNNVDNKLYKVMAIQNNDFTCEDFFTGEAKLFNITQVTLSKIIRSGNESTPE